MGKKVKIGKQRKDKFYQLAKETGYRSRAAFKLIQLNRKYEFLQKSRVLVDLCAAPGGWLQVSQKYMPVSSLVIGVDLVPIRPLGKAITLQEDITTDRCRQALNKELKTWKADVVLHDGAPNVGKSWVHDAYAQAQLTLQALKLATELLLPGGWFVTKVFRSKDYHALLWVFKKLFKKVHATKPQASRHESAEIFVVCQGYTAPDKIDSKFLDPAYLFKDVDVEPVTKQNLLQIDKKNKKKKAEGYPEGDYTLYHQLSGLEFIKSTNHVELLSKCSEIVLDSPVIVDHPLTTDEIKECCKDIKVLGPKELKAILVWRKKIKQYLETQEKKEIEKDLEGEEEVKNKEEEMNNKEEKEEDEIVKQIEESKIEEAQELKRKKKKILKERRKLRDKMNLQMVIKNDEPIQQQDDELFQLARIKTKKDLSQVEEDNIVEGLDPTKPQENDEEVKNQNLKRKWVDYNKDNHEYYWSIGNNEENISEDGVISDDDEEGKRQFEDSGDESDLEGSLKWENEDDNPLLVDLTGEKKKFQAERKAELWFQKDTFAELDEDAEEDLEIEMITESLQKKQKKEAAQSVEHSKSKPEKTEENKKSGESYSSDDSETSNILKVKSSSSKMNNSAMAENVENIENEVETSHPTVTKKKKKKIKLDPEGLALGSMMIRSQKAKSGVIEHALYFTIRYTFNDENLPDWFVKDEELHYKKAIPVTAEMVSQYKERLKEINARPIKKVAEAKARKKKRALKRMEKARKKAENITDSTDMTDKEKVQHIKSIYKKAVQGKKEKEITYVVAKKGMGKRVHRPAGVKGQFRVVDPRMKKDNRRKKTEEKNFKRKKGKSRRQKRT
ncbi:pre-rRNA processing protein FTSJ3-like [Limulus polyphemus]|uniref:Putative rRNA methyltransferase n=1 Tax=Limulus polyphemus TaxID=6850 RepID=A0ABM1TNL6_LIMPO|nr:pre-rRNA processing protein FTSJ3-like [Limulus polyphemus]